MSIPWTARRRNEDVIEEAETDRDIVKTIRQRQMHFTEHIRKAKELKDMCLTGKKQEKRTSFGRSLLRRMDDRENWRFMVANVVRDKALRR